MLLINKSVEIKSSLEWIKASFAIFREKPLQFIVLGIFSTLVFLLPVFGNFIAPFFLVRFAVITQKIEQNEPVLFSTIFDDFFVNRQVIKLALVSLAITAVFLGSQYGLEQVFKFDIKSPPFIILKLMFFILSFVLQAALWLSPLICLFNPNVEPLSAMVMSLKACCFNIVTLLFYAILVIFFSIIAILPLGLGLLIWLPMMNIISYFIYRSVFINNQMARQYHPI